MLGLRRIHQVKIWIEDGILFLVQEKNVPFPLENWECSHGWREGANIPCGKGEMFLFSGRGRKVLFAGGKKCFLGWRAEDKIPLGEGVSFLFLEREGNVLFGGRNVSLA